MSTAKALRRALARTAEDAWSLVLVCSGVQLDLLDQDGVVAALRPDTLLIVLDGPGGAIGLAQVDREILTGVTEIQTIQQVTKMPVDTRPLTHTDAAMMAPLLDGALAEFVENLAENPLRPQFEGYRFGAMLEDPRSASLLLDAAEYRTFHAEVDLALGRRTGTVSLFLPDRVLAAPEDGKPAPGAEPHREAMLNVPARLDCILSRVRMPLVKAEALKAGDLITLPAAALDGVEIVAANGAVVAGGRLGQMNGARAVRINWPKSTGTGAMAAAGADAMTSQGGFDEADAALAIGAETEAEFSADDAGSVDFPGGFTEEVDDDLLPDLPPLDFEDGDDFGGDFGGDFDAAALEDDGAVDADEDFAAATMDFDFET
ncbi:flagellar motor switch protein FliM [Citreimonas salinaria]|uniref:Flagellar motor switch protein FliM n=2 Tax=Citreimonas salinaria TaxID=321339 RepID=A0A1H3JNJ6_9RHOB|nr:flagellar motor switch protein FliM [Citreimonas salinaria]